MPAKTKSVKTRAYRAAQKAKASRPPKPPSPLNHCPASLPTGNLFDDIVNYFVPPKNELLQTRKDTCFLMATRTVLADMKGTAPNEDEMAVIGERSGGYKKCAGTNNPIAVLNEFKIPATLKTYPKLNDIGDALDAKKAVILGLDARPLWGGRYEKNPDVLGHGVRAMATKRDQAGNVSEVYIYDSGVGKYYWVSADKMQRSLDGFKIDDKPGGYMVISNDSLPQPLYFERGDRRLA